MKTVNERLETIGSNKVAIKSMSEENRVLFKELFVLVNEEVKSIRMQSMFKDSKKSVLVTVAKSNLSATAKDFGLFSLVCNYISLGLSLNLQDESITVNTIKQVVTLINKGVLTKSKANKAKDIKALVSQLNKELKEIKLQEVA